LSYYTDKTQDYDFMAEKQKPLNVAA